MRRPIGLRGPELFAVRPTGLRILVTARLRARESDALAGAATLQWEGPLLARQNDPTGA
ncbi:MAG: hypothetical protein R3E79_40395 [Caldilineaceae bacterium]